MNGNLYSATIGALIGVVIGGTIAEPVNDALQVLVGAATIGATLSGGYAALTSDASKRMTRFGLIGGAVGTVFGLVVIGVDAVFG